MSQPLGDIQDFIYLFMLYLFICDIFIYGLFIGDLFICGLFILYDYLFIYLRFI
jgi:hypothetical protein